MTQYVLAPLVVHAGKDCALVIGNFERAQEQFSDTATRHFVRVESLGDGLELFRGEPR